MNEERDGAAGRMTGRREDGGSVRAVLVLAARRLAPGSGTPRLDAELLMATALGISRETLLLSRLDDPVPEGFSELLARRERGEPVAYITGRRDFWTIDLQVGPGVLVPRPDSETLIEAALEHFGTEGPRSILDLGTGSGALLLAALDQWPNARGLGVDRSAVAVAAARANAERLGLSVRGEIRLGDWCDGIVERFDLILCNPPYVEADAVLPADVVDWEPHSALFAGCDGLDTYRRLSPMIGPRLAPEGIACVELGLGQHERAAELFEAQGLEARFRHDLSGRVRCLILNRRRGP